MSEKTYAAEVIRVIQSRLSAIPDERDRLVVAPLVGLLSLGDSLAIVDASLHKAFTDNLQAFAGAVEAAYEAPLLNAGIQARTILNAAVEQARN